MSITSFSGGNYFGWAIHVSEIIDSLMVVLNIGNWLIANNADFLKVANISYKKYLVVTTHFVVSNRFKVFMSAVKQLSFDVICQVQLVFHPIRSYWHLLILNQDISPER